MEFIENGIFRSCGHNAVANFKKGNALRQGSFSALDVYTNVYTIWLYSRNGDVSWAVASASVLIACALVQTYFTLVEWQRERRREGREEEDTFWTQCGLAACGLLNLIPLRHAYAASSHSNADINADGGLRYHTHRVYMYIVHVYLISA